MPVRELAEIAREGRRGAAQTQPRARPNRVRGGLRFAFGPGRWGRLKPPQPPAAPLAFVSASAPASLP
ncbi:unnamed protein product, partial [marine sediment metagenome]